ncbi:MAG: glycoside hydrolase family 30 protein, partial [Planctomycetes bacterium]|nr:glycoside hydrolase family 30 protein [Planctomycetota bacterium]
MTLEKIMKVEVYLTAKDTDDRLSKKADLELKQDSVREAAMVRADDCRTYQKIEGFGGAFTEAASSTLDKMSPANQEEILKAYFDKESGLAYSLCRTHINSCDFALGNYAYTETDGDVEFKDFTIDRDRKSLLPMIKRAQEMSDEPFVLFASPWSPPAWMKTTGMMNKGGKLKPEYFEAWARYYCRYIREYEKEGIKIWGITVQNEPEATQTWDSCVYTAEEEKDFVRDYLGPIMEKEGLSDVKIIIWDHNRDMLFERARVAYNDPEASKYIWGTGFHWYCGDNFDNARIHHEVFPDKQLLFTEGCQEGGPHLGSWDTGERYGKSMIHDLNNYTCGWCDWNMILDETGGPNHVNNLCSAPIIADTKNDKLLYQSSYYYIGHLAKFIRPGAEKIVCATTRDELEATACKNPDGSVAIVVMNRSDKEMP